MALRVAGLFAPRGRRERKTRMTMNVFLGLNGKNGVSASICEYLSISCLRHVPASLGWWSVSTQFSGGMQAPIALSGFPPGRDGYVSPRLLGGADQGDIIPCEDVSRSFPKLAVQPAPTTVFEQCTAPEGQPEDQGGRSAFYKSIMLFLLGRGSNCSHCFPAPQPNC